jgi:hypothetical protein
MSDMLERPMAPNEVRVVDNSLDDFDVILDGSFDPEKLAAELGISPQDTQEIAMNRVRFSDISYRIPFSRHEDVRELAFKKVLAKDSAPSDVEGTAPTPFAGFRRHVVGLLTQRGFSPDAAREGEVILSELVGNIKLHGEKAQEKGYQPVQGEKEERYSGECRIVSLEEEIAQECGKAATQVTVFFISENYFDQTTSSDQEKQRGALEGGGGLTAIKTYAEENGGEVGMYRVLHDKEGNPANLPPDIACGKLVMWASMRTEIPSDSPASE